MEQKFLRVHLKQITKEGKKKNEKIQTPKQ